MTAIETMLAATALGLAMLGRSSGIGGDVELDLGAC